MFAFCSLPVADFEPRPLQVLKIYFNCVYKTVGVTFGSTHSQTFSVPLSPPFLMLINKRKNDSLPNHRFKPINFLPPVSVFISFSFFLFFEDIPNSDSESFNPALWEEQRKHRAQVAFECDEDKDERETPPRVRYS